MGNLEEESLANWVLQEDKVPILLCLSLYTSPLTNYKNYFLSRKTPRAALWVNNETRVLIVGLKGTSTQSLDRDLNDDLQIVANKNFCGNLSITDDATKLLEEYNSSIEVITQTVVIGVEDIIPFAIIFVGHSLGGTGALCMVSKYENSRAISFNGGASPTNPIRSGPGPGLATHYHIVGDLISSHMYPQAAKVILVKIPGMTFGSLSPHNSDNITKPGEIYTPNQEDEEYQKWGYSQSIVYGIVKKLLWLKPLLGVDQIASIVYNNPIPNSTRDLST